MQSDVDLEEIESRLYSQVFHSTEAYEQEQSSTVEHITESSSRHVSNFTVSNVLNSKRYFAGKQNIQETPQCAHPEASKTNSETIVYKEKQQDAINEPPPNKETSKLNKNRRRRIRRKIKKKLNINGTVDAHPQNGNQSVRNPANKARDNPYYNLRKLRNPEPVPNQQFCNAINHEMPLMMTIPNQQFFDARNSAGQTNHIPPLLQMVHNPQIYDPTLPVNQELNFHEPPAIIAQNPFYDPAWAAIKMPISIQDLIMPDTSILVQTTPEPAAVNLISPNSFVLNQIPPNPVVNQNTPEPSTVKQTTPNQYTSEPSIINQTRSDTNIEKTELPNLNLAQQLPIFAVIPEPSNQFELDSTYLNNYLAKVDNIDIIDHISPLKRNQSNDEIIVLSDSDNDSVVLVPSPVPVIYIIEDSSDELESTNLELQVLDRDPCTNTIKTFDEIQNVPSPDIQNLCSSPETMQSLPSPNSEIQIAPHLETPPQVSLKTNEITETERTELLFTPDSNTNDFIENDVDTLNKRGSGFNFNLHGSDLDLSKFVKPSRNVPRLDLYETESSCSEAGTITKVFSEVDFESPTKEIFCEPDLASFSKFITPIRKSIEPDLEFSPVKTKALKKRLLSQSSENDNFLSDSENNSDATSLVVKKKSKNRKKKDKQKKRKQKSNDVLIEEIEDAPNETESVSQKKKDKKKKLNVETCEQPAIINDENFHLKKKNKRKKFDKEIYEQIDDIQDSKESDNVQKKKDKRKKLDDEMCAENDEANNEIENVSQKKERRKKLDEEINEYIDSRNMIDTENVIQKKKDKRKKLEEVISESSEIADFSQENEIDNVPLKKKDKRKKFDDEAVSEEIANISDSTRNISKENVQLKKKDKRKRMEDTAIQQTNLIVSISEEHEIATQTKRKEKRKKSEDEASEIVNPNNSQTDVNQQKKKEKRKKLNDESCVQTDIIIANPLSNETKIEDEETCSRLEIKIVTSLQQNDQSEETKKPMIDCDIPMTSLDQNVVQPNSDVNFSFINAWSKIPLFPKKTNGKEESKIKYLEELPQIFQNSETSISNSPLRYKEPSHSSAPETKTKRISESSKDSPEIIIELQIPQNTEPIVKLVPGTARDSHPTLKELKNNDLEISQIEKVLDSKIKKISEITKQKFTIQEVSEDANSKITQQISKELTQTSNPIISDMAQMPEISKSIRNSSQTSKEIPQVSKQNPLISDVPKKPKTPSPKNVLQKSLDSKTKEISETFKEIPQTSKKASHTSSNPAKPAIIIDLREDDYIPISSGSVPNIPQRTKEKYPTNIVLNVSPSKQGTSKASNKKIVTNPFSYINIDRRTFSDFWTDDMKKFYEDSWGQENYDIDMVLNSMPSDASKWKIIVEDKYSSQSPRKRGPACQKCKEIGHSRYNCTRFPGPMKCSICGFSGHFHARCPNLMCTTCGNKGGYHTTSCYKCAHFSKIMCSLCHTIGHQNTKCPDLWRRYHLTTEDQPTLNAAILKLKPHSKRWCSNCARRGHLQNVCTFMNPEHFPTLPHIVSYDPCYNRIFNISPAVRLDNIPTVIPNVNLSQIRDHRNNMFEFNKAKYENILKILKRQCRYSDLPYIPDIERLERSLHRDQVPRNIIGNIYKLRSLIQRRNMWN